MKQSFISFVLTLLMSLVGLNSFAQFSGAGSGTESDPYLISNPNHFNQMRNFLNKTVYFKLANDIDLTEFLEDENPSEGWLPIGDYISNLFIGVLDGNGKTIKGLWIKRASHECAGIFACIKNATIKDLTIEAANIECTSGGIIAGIGSGSITITGCSISGVVKGKNNLGGFVGQLNPAVDYYGSTEGRVGEMDLSNNIAKVSVIGTGQCIGGFAGFVSATPTMSNCIFYDGEVRGKNYVGGLFGKAAGRFTDDGVMLYITHCGFIGEIAGASNVGGLIGYIKHNQKFDYTDSRIKNSFSISNIDATGDNIGGLIGYDSGFTDEDDIKSRTYIDNNYYCGSVKGSNNVGGIVGYKSGGVVSSCLATGSVEGNSYVAGIISSGSFPSIYNNVTIHTHITAATSFAMRIGGGPNPGSPKENKAYNKTIVTVNGVVQDIVDSYDNGTGVGAFTLKDKATYVAMDFDFDGVWAISDGEGYPYIIGSEQYLPKDPKDVANLTINPIAAVTYNGLAQTPAVTVTDGTTTLTDGTDYTTSYSNNINAGTAAVTVTGIGNYTGMNTTTFTIQKASLTVTAKSYTISQGDPLPTFEADYSGFMNGETSSVLTTQPTFNCSASSISNPGEYDITVSGVTADNYSISYVKGKLTISAGGEEPGVPAADTDIALLDNTIYVNQTELYTGNEATLSIRMKNNVAIRGFQFDMYLPEGITPIKNSKGRILATLTNDRLEEDDEHTLTSSEQPDGAIRFLCGSQYEETFTGNDGEVFTLKVSVAEDMEDGDYPLLMKNIKLSENNISNYYEVELVKTTLSVSSYTPGDINADGKIDVSDYIGVANHILGHTPEGFVMRAGDVDDSGSIDVSDYLGIGNIIHTGSVYGSNRAMGARASVEPSDLTTMDNVVYVLSDTAEPGEDMTLSLCMKNTAAIRGFQFDLYLPEGVTVKKNSKGRILAALNKARLEEDDEHTMTTSEQPDGAIRFLCGSQYEETFTGTDGEVATLQVTIGSDMEYGDYPVILRDMKLSENDIRNFYETEQVVTMLTIPNTTGISSVHRATSADDRYYNLQGQRTEPAKKGLYINNGRKVVIK